jgi:hypothetical protein
MAADMMASGATVRRTDQRFRNDFTMQPLRYSALLSPKLRPHHSGSLDDETKTFIL